MLVLLLGFLIIIALQGCGQGGGGASPTPAPTPPAHGRPILPTSMIAGYTSGASVEKITSSVKDGVNVIFWSFMELSNNTLSGTVTAEAVGTAYQALVDLKREDVLHFVSFGGWDASHSLAGTCGNLPCSGEAYAASFRAWNEQMKTSIPHFPGFAGIDWDIEGVDELASPANEFSMEAYEVILNMSQALVTDFLISMVPPQTYLNCQDEGFNTNLRNVAESNPNFHNAGKNAYAILLAKCPECFDLVMVQLYESFSPAGFDMYWQGDRSHVGMPGWPRMSTHTIQDMTRVLRENMQCLFSGWNVNFGGYWNMWNYTIKVPAEKIVMGLANGLALPVAPTFKVPFFEGGPAATAWCEGVSYIHGGTQRVRGFMYWDIGDDYRDNPTLAANLSAGMRRCEQGGDPRSFLV